MRGIAVIYQGQELGLHDPTFRAIDEYRDIETIHAYNELKATGKWTQDELLAKMQFGSRDCARTPIPWTTGTYGGFTTGTPWIKTQIDAGFTVEEQEADDHSVLQFYREMLRIRKSEPCLRDGEFTQLENNDAAFSVYTRGLAAETRSMSCAISAKRTTPCLPASPTAWYCSPITGGKAESLRPFEALWIKA